MLVRVALTFLSLFLRVEGSFLEPCASGTVGRFPSLSAEPKVMSFAFSEGPFDESGEAVEFDSDVTTVLLLSVLSKKE